MSDPVENPIPKDNRALALGWMGAVVGILLFFAASAIVRIGAPLRESLHGPFVVTTLWWLPVMLLAVRRSRSLIGRVAFILFQAGLSYFVLRFATEPYVSSKLVMAWALALAGGVIAAYCGTVLRYQCRM